MVLEFSKSCRADVKDSFEQSKMRVVSSTYLLNLISFSCKNAFKCFLLVLTFSAAI